MSVDLERPVAGLAGVGPKLLERLARLGITTTGDLLHHYPRRYEDFSTVLPIRALKPGPVTVRGKILQVASRRAVRRRLTITEAIITDGTGTLKAVWFNQPYLKNALRTDAEVYMSGKLEFKSNDLALQSPSVEPADQPTKNTARIVPVYPETEGVTSKQLRNWIAGLLAGVDELPETLPPSVIKRARLMSQTEAIREVHFPSSQAKLKAARHRIAFDELFGLILTGLVIKHEVVTEEAPAIELKVEMAKEFIDALGFDLTDSQRKSAWQILQDMARTRPMNRLLEGDVGSGKTVVALMAAVMAAANGYQAALLVPTEILARQHLSRIDSLLQQLGFRAEILTGGLPTARKRQVRELAASGQADLIIGTHALLSDEVKFKNLGLVIIDEQHRFGVQQRQALKAKAGRLPHLLSMTATPIPRSLALTIYGDLDISVITELPPGRRPVSTRVVPPEERDDLYRLIDQEIERGRQVFVVCPLIEPSDRSGARSAVAEAERLKGSVFAHRRIGLIHGKLAAADKQQAMNQFAAGELDILAATSVIEVGIDVPNASVMLVEAADRFGLAALHQLRGRIGRGGHRSHCFLLSEDPGEAALSRLEALERTADGFRLAQIDLELRGPGQIYGTRQHGVLDLVMADITDARLVAQVRQIARDYLEESGGVVQYDQLRDRVNRLKAVTTLD